MALSLIQKLNASFKAWEEEVEEYRKENPVAYSMFFIPLISAGDRL